MIAPSPWEARQAARSAGPSTWVSQRRFNRVMNPLMFFGALPILAVAASRVGAILWPPFLANWDEVPRAAQPWLAAALLLGMSRLLYWFRNVARRTYGRVEIAVAFVAAYVTVDLILVDGSPGVSMAVALSLASACYIAVRGFDNSRQGELETAELRQLLVDTAHASMEGRYEWWCERLKRQDADFANNRSDDPVWTTRLTVSDKTGHKHTISATPWWHRVVGEDILVAFEIVSDRRFWHSARYERVLEKPLASESHTGNRERTSSDSAA